MRTSRAYFSASLAHREGVNLKELDPLDREIFILVEEIKNRQQYFQVMAAHGSGKEFLDAAHASFFPFNEVKEKEKSVKMLQDVKDMVNQKYTIKRGPFGQMLVVEDKN